VRREGWRRRIVKRFATLFYVLVAVLASAPAWIVRYPPLEDLPFHLSTLRQIHSFHDPQYGFDKDFFLNLGGTQYALYYIIGDVIAHVLGVRWATIAMMCIYLGGTPLALRLLLRELGKDERLCIFVVPLLVNSMFIIGLLPFVFGIPLMFLAWALSVRWFYAPSPLTVGTPKQTRIRSLKLGIGLAALAVALFYAHVFAYGLFGVGFAAMFPWGKPRKYLVSGAPVVPSLLCVLWWTKASAQGQESFGALGKSGAHAPFLEGIRNVAQWTCDVFRDSSDERTWILLALLVVLAIGLGQGARERVRPELRGFVVVPIVCTILYFVTGDMLGDVWLFSQRFPVPALMTAIPFLPMRRGASGLVVTLLALALAIGSTVNVCSHFIQFQLEEVGAIDEAIAKMAPGKHVAALIYDRGSSVVNMSPFLHFGSYYQADKGGVVQFTNSGALYWPVRFKEGHYPPPGKRPRLRWEWTPEQVPISELYPYYDYVLVRGNGFQAPRGSFHVIFHGDRWTVWQRDGAT
jgi:hypothetical protein